MKLDDVKKLQQKKYREEFGHFLVEGEHLVLELQKAASRAQMIYRMTGNVSIHYADQWRKQH